MKIYKWLLIGSIALMTGVFQQSFAEGTLPFGDTAIPFGDGTLPFGMSGSAKVSNQGKTALIQLDLNFLDNTRSGESANSVFSGDTEVSFQLESLCPDGMKNYPVRGVVVINGSDDFQIAQVCAPERRDSGRRQVTAVKGADILTLSGSLSGSSNRQRYQGSASLRYQGSDTVRFSFDLQ